GVRLNPAKLSAIKHLSVKQPAESLPGLKSEKSIFKNNMTTSFPSFGRNMSLQSVKPNKFPLKSKILLRRRKDLTS
ncbi:MAG: hypothetical protein LUF33_05125, partial [Clostridiales bacterium]|nr:hypothetical protein [Clostridiales bacterium]